MPYWAGTYRPLPGNPHNHGNLTLDEALRPLPRIDPEAAISRHTAAFARVLIVQPEIHPVPLVYTITAPTAIQNLLPYFPQLRGRCPGLGKCFDD